MTFIRKPIIKEVNGLCRVVLHLDPDGNPSAFHVGLEDGGIVADPRLGYDCLIRAIGDALVDAGVNINAV